MMYLENVLSTMNNNANVMVMLSSFTTYEDGFSMQDCCGNHYVSNWMGTINSFNLENIFEVRGVECKQYADGMIQWVIYLNNEKGGHYTRILDVESNNYGLKRILYGI